MFRHPDPRGCNSTTASWHAWASSAVSAGAIAVLETGKKVRARCLIGTDGANSRVARALNVPKPNYAGYTAYRSAPNAMSASANIHSMH